MSDSGEKKTPVVVRRERPRLPTRVIDRVAEELRPISRKLTHADRYWFQGDRGRCDVYLREDPDGRIDWVQVFVTGGFVTCDCRKNTCSSGRVEDSEGLIPRSKLMQPESPPDLDYVGRVIRMLEATEHQLLGEAAGLIRQAFEIS